METIYSDAEDCRKLAARLFLDLGSKISFDGMITETPFGKYHMIPFIKYNGDYDEFNKDAVSFGYKFKENEFLRVTIEEELYPLSKGLKLAVLSDFCEAITRLYGKPSFFYTIKGDDNKSLNLQWSFNHSKEDIEHIQKGDYFDDAEIDTLIEFKESNQEKEEFFKRTGLPYELIDIILENEYDFLDAKAERRILKGKEDKKDDERIRKRTSTI